MRERYSCQKYTLLHEREKGRGEVAKNKLDYMRERKKEVTKNILLRERKIESGKVARFTRKREVK